MKILVVDDDEEVRDSLSEILKKKGFSVKNIPGMLSKHSGNAKNLIAVFKREVWYGQTMLRSFSSRSVSKPFVACCLNILGVSLILFSVILYLTTGVKSYWLLCVGIIFVVGPIGIYALVAAVRSGKVLNFFPYSLIFTFYVGGRMFSLYYALLGKQKKVK